MFDLKDVYGPLHNLTEGRPVEKLLTGREILKRAPDHRHPTAQTGRINLINMPRLTAIEPHRCDGRNKSVFVTKGIGTVTLLLQQSDDGVIETISMRPGEEQAIPAGWSHTLVNEGPSEMEFRVESDRDPVPGDVTWRSSTVQQLTIQLPPAATPEPSKEHSPTTTS